MRLGLVANLIRVRFGSQVSQNGACKKVWQMVKAHPDVPIEFNFDQPLKVNRFKSS